MPQSETTRPEVSPGESRIPAAAESHGPELAGDLLDAISDAVEAVAQSVAGSIVAIRITRPGPLSAPGYSSQSHVGSVGSGVVISGAGLIATAAHVVSRAEQITITDQKDVEYSATVIGRSEVDDLALLKIDGVDLTPIDLTDARVAPGRIVLAIGRPPKIGSVVSSGIVNVMGRSTRNSSGDLLDGLIQTSAAVEPGVSGGALVDSRGRLAGIVTSATDSTRSISFAVPTEKLRAMVKTLLPAAAGIDSPFHLVQPTHANPDTSPIQADQADGNAG